MASAGGQRMRTAGTGQRVAVAVGVVALLLVAVWFFFLRAGDVDGETTSGVATRPGSAAKVAARPAGALKARVETFDVFAPRDPFDPLVSDRGGDGTDAPQATTGNGSAAVAGSARGDTVGGHRVRLIDVFKTRGKRRAQVQIDGTAYTVDEGEIFAQSFQLLSISGECATMLFGDDQFTLCEGEEILK